MRRCAEQNNGVPLGRSRFEQATGIRDPDWRGRYWARWGDAVAEAGYAPNTLQNRKHTDEELLVHLVQLARQLHHFPTTPELRMQRQADPTFASDKVFAARLGNRADQIERVMKFVEGQGSEFDDVLDLCRTAQRKLKPESAAAPSDGEVGVLGHVYLLRVGRDYKIGRASSFDRRERELAIQLPERAERVHVITTDDPVGIERYWHLRFADRRKNGEWFGLSADDVRAFKRRKFM